MAAGKRNASSGDEATWDAIIIGSGMGGMTAGASLAHAGKRVLVLEQHHVLGGLTHTFFLLASTDDRGHLHALARLSRILHDESFLPELTESEDAHAAKEVFDRFESALQD